MTYGQRFVGFAAKIFAACLLLRWLCFRWQDFGCIWDLVLIKWQFPLSVARIFSLSASWALTSVLARKEPGAAKEHKMDQKGTFKGPESPTLLPMHSFRIIQFDAIFLHSSPSISQERQWAPHSWCHGINWPVNSTCFWRTSALTGPSRSNWPPTGPRAKRRSWESFCALAPTGEFGHRHFLHPRLEDLIESSPALSPVAQASVSKHDRLAISAQDDRGELGDFVTHCRGSSTQQTRNSLPWPTCITLISRSLVERFVIFFTTTSTSQVDREP